MGPEQVYYGEHLDLNTLKQEQRAGQINNGYILNSAPAYPRPELHVSHISHSTDLDGLEGIREDRGFRGFRNPNIYRDLKVVWFSLTVSPDDLRDAEKRNMTVVRPGGREEELQEDLKQGTLQTFARSPAFRSSSRYGSFRFTFSLKDVLDKYSQQFCRGQEPVLRVYRTDLYKQEVMYAVLVHSPDDLEFSELPLLEDSSVCTLRAEPKPYFIWRPQSMSDAYSFGLTPNNGINNGITFTDTSYYVWDHVALALHVGNKVLKFGLCKLRHNLRFCERDVISVPRDGRVISYQEHRGAKKTVRKLWPHYYSTVRHFNKSDFHINR